MSSLARWDPFDSLSTIDRDVRRLLSLFMAPVPAWHTPGSWCPVVDVYRESGDFVLQVELPGIDPEKDLEVTVEDNLLRIKGRRSSERAIQDKDLFLRERFTGAFDRAVALPEGVDGEALEASYVDGVLTVRVPYAGGEEIEKRRIPVETRREAKRIKKSTRTD